MTTTEMISETLGSIMTQNPQTVSPKMLMTDVARIFENEPFHHIPVINENNEAVGILSKSDVLQLQNKFTRFNCISSDVINKQYFDSLLVSEVMTQDPVSLEIDTPIQSLLDLFIENRLRSVLVLNKNRLVGIVTPYDILKLVNDKLIINN